VHAFQFESVSSGYRGFAIGCSERNAKFYNKPMPAAVVGRTANAGIDGVRCIPTDC